MKIEWETGDIRGGRIVGKSGREERWLIMYMGGGLYGLASLVDGSAAYQNSAPDQIAEVLNKNGDIPVEWIT